MKVLWAAALAALVGGCAGAPQAMDSTAGPLPAAAPLLDVWGGIDRQTLVEVRSQGPGMELDVLCLTGGGPEVRNGDGRVLNGTSHLEVRVRIDPTFTGQQIGYSIDGGAVTWLPVVPGGQSATQTVAVAPEQWEADRGPLRWAFYEQMNLPPPGQQECYTGGGVGTKDYTVHAVRG